MSEETIKNMFYFGWDMFPGEVIISLIVMLLLAIISFVIYFLFKNADPTKPEKGFRLLIVMLVEKVEAFTVDIMGEKIRSFAGYAIAVGGYIAFSFIFGLLGLPGPMTYLGNTLSIALCTFGLIHFTAMKKNKWGYFKRYIDPFAIMLPINLLSMWAPLLSLSLRLFGNALAGYTLMSIVYFFLGQVSEMIFGGFIGGGFGSVIIPPLITPILHAYFDVFSSAIQVLIFVMLTMIFVAQEDNDDEEDTSVKA